MYIPSGIDINQICNDFTDKILDSASKTITNKTIVSRPDDPPWMHNAVRKAIRVRRRLHTKAKRSNTMEDWEKYRKARNVCVDKVRNAKHAYYVKLADQLKSDNLSNKNGGKYF